MLRSVQYSSRKSILLDVNDVNGNSITNEYLKYYCHADTLGTSSAPPPHASAWGLNTTSGTLLQPTVYSLQPENECTPFGKTTIYSGTGPDGLWNTLDDQVAQFSRIYNNYIFQARRLDQESGLYYFRTRHYSPAEVRFIQRDKPGDWFDGGNAGNGNNFVSSNPFNSTDPFGDVVDHDGDDPQNPLDNRPGDIGGGNISGSGGGEIQGGGILQAAGSMIYSVLRLTGRFIKFCIGLEPIPEPLPEPFEIPTRVKVSGGIPEPTPEPMPSGNVTYGKPKFGPGFEPPKTPKSPVPIPEHHLMTNKNRVSTARGGPWTPRFEAMAKRAGMTLNDILNKVRIPGHYGPHPEAYHKAVFQRLSNATEGLSGDAYSTAFRAELDAIRSEASTPGTPLNQLVVG